MANQSEDVSLIQKCHSLYIYAVKKNNNNPDTAESEAPWGNAPQCFP